MNRRQCVVAAVLAVLACSRPPTAASVLEAAQRTIGNPSSIRYSGTGWQGAVGQAIAAGGEWPRRELTSYARTIDYDTRASREELIFAQPVFGGRQQNAIVVGDQAWSLGPDGPLPQPAAAEERQLQIWLTPHGFIRGALASGNVRLLPSTAGTAEHVLSFTALGKYRIEGVVSADNLVVRVSTMVANPVMGDMPVVARYGDYRDAGGMQFPASITVDQGGFQAWELAISDVSANPGLELPVPKTVAEAAIPPVTVTPTRLAPGVWHLTGGSHHSVLVEFPGYNAIIEAPLNEAWSLAVLAAVRDLTRNKPVRYVLTSHHHFDHVGGLRTYVAQGATVVTHAANVSYFEKVLAAPATVSPDAQSRSKRPPVFHPVSGVFELAEGRQRLVAYATGGDSHTSEYTLVYLPGPRILVEADAYTPGPAGAPPPASAPPDAVALAGEIDRRQLDVATIAPLHGRGAVPMAELRRFIGRR